MEWVDGNLGSKVTMKYPAVCLWASTPRARRFPLAFAGENQHQDAGPKMVHTAPNTSSTIVSKSVARGGGRTSYRGLVQVMPAPPQRKHGALRRAAGRHDLRTDTYPYVDVRNDDVVHRPRGHRLQGQ